MEDAPPPSPPPPPPPSPPPLSSPPPLLPPLPSCTQSTARHGEPSRLSNPAPAAGLGHDHRGADRHRLVHAGARPTPAAAYRPPTICSCRLCGGRPASAADQTQGAGGAREELRPLLLFSPPSYLYAGVPWHAACLAAATRRPFRHTRASTVVGRDGTSRRRGSAEHSGRPGFFSNIFFLTPTSARPSLALRPGGRGNCWELASGCTAVRRACGSTTPCGRLIHGRI
jgi:hypothetical protein